MTRRLLGAAAIAAGVIASIATSPATWSLQEIRPIGAFLDEGLPPEARRIRLELTGAADLPHGQIYVHLDAVARTDGGAVATVTARLIDDGDPENVMESTIDVAPGTSVPLDLYLPAWTRCEVGPCVETFTLHLERAEGFTAPSLEVGGDVTVDVGEDDRAQPPAGAALRVEVTEIEP